MTAEDAGTPARPSTWYNRVDLILAVGLTLLGVGIVVAAAITIPPAQSAYTFDPIGPRGFSFVIGILSTLLGAVLVVDTVEKRRTGPGLWALAPEDPDETGDDPRYPASTTRAWAIVAVSVVFGFILVPVGYLIAAALHVSACMWLMGSRSKAMLVVFPIIYSLATYALFAVLLNVRIADGILEPVIEAVGL